MSPGPRIVSPEARLLLDDSSGQWVIVAPGRATRPIHFQPVADSTGACPFCLEPPPDRIRVFVDSREFRREVVVHHHEHLQWFNQMELDDVIRVVSLWQERFRAMERSFENVALYGRRGVRAGSECDHPHSVIEGSRPAPRRLAGESARAGTFRECRFCGDAVRLGAIMLDENDCFFLILPEAGRFAYETWIVPKVHRASFTEVPSGEIAGFSDAIRRYFRALEVCLPGVSFHYALHSWKNRMHWHFEVMPRLTNTAGFEFGTGIMVNSVPPALAADQLRQALARLPGG